MRNTLSKTVSVIVPCYNYAHYLGECLDSLIFQTYPVHEIIVVDDGGKDNCEEVCKKYPAVKYLRKANGGLSSARNAGISIATGDYIMCLDADDKLVPGAIEEHVKLMISDKTISQCALMEFGDRHVVMIPTRDTSLKRILLSNTIFCNAMYPRKAWVEVGGYDENTILRWGREDHEFWLRLLANGYEVNKSDFIALRYRVHDGQMSEATLRPHHKEIEEYFHLKHRDLYEQYDLLTNEQ